MDINPDDMEEAENAALWLEVTEDGWEVSEGEDPESSEVVESDDGFFGGVIQEIDTEAGDYEDSRLYKLRNSDFDGVVLFWGKTDFNSRIDNNALDTGDTVVFKHDGIVPVEGSDGEDREMQVFDVRYERL